MKRIKNIILAGTDNRPMALDIFFEDNMEQRPVVIYAHGFNGFKDWGNFDLIADKFSAAGFVFIKFNFSHNGTTPEDPEAFTDLEAFGHNNYTIEINDLRFVVDWVCDKDNGHGSAIDRDDIYLIGHSMGGGIAILEAAADERIKKLVTWAGISECKTPWGDWPEEKMAEWKQQGVQHYTNGRTKQQMPVYYQLYEDFARHRSQLDIEQAIGQLAIPVLICHGTQDNAVPVQKAFDLKNRQPSAKLFTVQSDHVFGRKHPWTESELPAAMEAVVNATLDFLK